MGTTGRTTASPQQSRHPVGYGADLDARLCRFPAPGRESTALLAECFAPGTASSLLPFAGMPDLHLPRGGGGEAVLRGPDLMVKADFRARHATVVRGLPGAPAALHQRPRWADGLLAAQQHNRVVEEIVAAARHYLLELRREALPAASTTRMAQGLTQDGRFDEFLEAFSPHFAMGDEQAGSRLAAGPPFDLPVRLRRLFRADGDMCPFQTVLSGAFPFTLPFQTAPELRLVPQGAIVLRGGLSESGWHKFAGSLSRLCPQPAAFLRAARRLFLGCEGRLFVTRGGSPEPERARQMSKWLDEFFRFISGAAGPWYWAFDPAVVSMDGTLAPLPVRAAAASSKEIHFASAFVRALFRIERQRDAGTEQEKKDRDAGIAAAGRFAAGAAARARAWLIVSYGRRNTVEGSEDADHIAASLAVKLEAAGRAWIEGLARMSRRWPLGDNWA